MKHFSVATAALAMAASTASAYLSVSYQLGSSTNGFDRWDIYVVNSGSATGTQLREMEFHFSSWSGTGPAFEVTDNPAPNGDDLDGVPDTVNLLSSSRTRIRINSLTSQNQFTAVTPTAEWAQPNPWVGSVTQFSGKVLNLGLTPATGIGFQVARIFMPIASGAPESPFNGFDFRGTLRGDRGPTVPFDIHAGANMAVAPVETSVDFPEGASADAPFSFGTSVSVVYGAYGPYTLAVRDLPEGVVIDSIVRDDSSSTWATFTVSGRVNQRLIGQTVVGGLYGSNGTLGGTSYFLLTVTPEPGAVGLLLTGCLLRRRRPAAGLCERGCSPLEGRR